MESVPKQKRQQQANPLIIKVSASERKILHHQIKLLHLDLLSTQSKCLMSPVSRRDNDPLWDALNKLKHLKMS